MALYLGRDSFYDEEKDQHYFILKIGYTADENIDKRLLNYTSHNPSFKFLFKILKGTEEHEKKLHHKFKKYLHHGNEWFEYREEIIEFFKSCSLEDIDKIKLSKRENISKLESRYPKIEITDEMSSEVKDFFTQWNKCKKTYMYRIKMICEFLLEYPQMSESIINNLADSDKIKQQLITLGPEKIKSLSYNVTLIKKAMGITIFDKTTLDSVIYSSFVPGQRYSKKYIKETLKSIYESADFHGASKASDLENWFEIRDMKVTVDGKQQAGFEIISVKQ